MSQTITITRIRPSLSFVSATRQAIVTEQSNSVVVVSRAGVPGPPGATGGGSSTKFTFSSPLATWNIPHNYGREATIIAYTPGGVQILAEIVHLSVNTAQVLFDEPTTGFAIAS